MMGSLAPGCIIESRTPPLSHKQSKNVYDKFMKFTSDNITAIIVALIGLVSTIIILLLNRVPKITVAEKRHEIKYLPKNKYFLLISVPILCTGLLLFAWITYSNYYPYIIITYPGDGSQVSINETVVGKSNRIPNNKAIWIIVYSFSSEKYFPSQNPALPDKSDIWTSPVIIGSTEDNGTKFYISAYLLDEPSRDELRNEMSRLDFSGLETLPHGAKLLHLITVYRKYEQ